MTRLRSNPYPKGMIKPVPPPPPPPTPKSIINWHVYVHMVKKRSI